MSNINLNTTYTMHLSLNSIKGYEELLSKYKRRLPEIAENIVNRVSGEGLKDNYKSTEIIPAENKGGVISGGIRTTDEKDTYKEFGTGIVGSSNPHPNLESGWIYDVNKHGEKGWVYPKSDGSFGWTKGIQAQKKFYEAFKRMEDSLPTIAKEELSK